MIVGDAMARSRDIDPNTAESQALTFRCFGEGFTGNDGAPGNGPNDTVDLPKRKCLGGIRSNIYFPSSVVRDNFSAWEFDPHLFLDAGTA